MRRPVATSVILAVLFAPSTLGVLPAHAEGAGPVTPPAAPPAATQPAPEKPDLRCLLRRKVDEKKVADIKAKIVQVDIRIERLNGFINERQEQQNKLPPGSRQAQKLEQDNQLNRDEIRRQQLIRSGLEAQQLSAEGKTMGWGDC